MKPQLINKKKSTTESKLGKEPNYTLLWITLFLIVFGVVMIADASVFVAAAEYKDELYFVKQHLVWLFFGSVAAVIAYFVDYRKLKPLVVPLLLINIGLLIAVLFLGEATNGSKRWFAIGQIPVQPAEFIKPIFILFLATFFSKENEPTNEKFWGPEFRKKVLKFGFFLAVILGLIILEPDLGTTMIVGISAFAIFVVSGTSTAHKLGTLALTGVGTFIAAIAAIIAPYRLDRVRTFLEILFTGRVPDPSGDGYQMYQILIGIASAGWQGVGFGQSRQRFGYLVEKTAHTDSIFAVYLEELGLFGAIMLIALWLGFFVVGISIAKKAPDRFGSFIAVGITTWLVAQALLNMAANVGLIPLTGLPLPFFTYGGSNTIVTLIGVALLLNISRGLATDSSTKQRIKA